MVLRLAILMLTITTTACASSRPETTSIEQAEGAQAEQVAATDGAVTKDDVICRREKRKGSNLSRKVCYKRGELEERASKVQNTMRESRALNSSTFIVFD